MPRSRMVRGLQAHRKRATSCSCQVRPSTCKWAYEEGSGEGLSDGMVSMEGLVTQSACLMTSVGGECASVV
jgi:hypothetical protein